MACPSTTTLSGSDSLRTGGYASTAAALAAFGPAVTAFVTGQAARYHCPGSCPLKSQGPPSFTLASAPAAGPDVYAMSPAGQVGPPTTFAAWGSFSWSIAVSCRAPDMDKLDGTGRESSSELLGKFIDDAKKFHDPTLLTGWLDNLTWGPKCDEWVEWMLRWLREHKLKDRGVKVEVVGLDVQHWYRHVLVRLTFPDGTVIYVDPWRDGPDAAVRPKDDYERDHPPDDAYVPQGF